VDGTHDLSRILDSTLGMIGMTEMRALRDMVQQEGAFIEDVIQEMGRVVVGQQHMRDRMLIALLTGGHILLQVVPGLAKTLAVNPLADVIDLDFQRIQLTPDLLPADFIGTLI